MSYGEGEELHTHTGSEKTRIICSLLVYLLETTKYPVGKICEVCLEYRYIGTQNASCMKVIFCGHPPQVLKTETCFKFTSLDAVLW